MNWLSSIRSLALTCLLPCTAFVQSGPFGIFANSGDVGNPSIKGSATFANGEYRITGSGTNIWGKRDQFQYLWKEMKGNFSITATVHFIGQGAEHRKAGIMVRQSLDPDAVYADVLIHGNGMPALQWRSRSGEDTNTFDLLPEDVSTFRIKLVRAGVKIYLYLAKGNAEPVKIANTEVSFQDSVLAGLVVCAHQTDASETAVFSDVSVETEATPASH